MRAALIGSGGSVLGREYPLDASIVTIGRRDENAIVIKDPTVSRKHAEIRRDGDAFVVVDKDSTSGVLLNGEPVTGEQRLRDGDRLGIGMSAVFLVQLQPDEAATITFAPPQAGDQGRTQFVTRTDLGDPRGIAAEPPMPPHRDEPVVPPPVPIREVPPVAPVREVPPSAPPLDAPRIPLAVPPPGAPPPPPPTFSAAPPRPRLRADEPVAPSFTPPASLPPLSAPPAVPQRVALPGGPNPAPRPAAPPAPASVVAPQRKSYRGLAIGLVVLLLLIVLIIAIVGVLVVRSGA